MPAPVINTLGNVGISAPPENTQIMRFRNEYPEYNDVDDETLMDGLHKKYYSDVPYDTFKEAFIKKYTPESGALKIFARNVESSVSSIAAGLTGFEGWVKGKDVSKEMEWFRQDQERLALGEPEAINRSVIDSPELLLNFKWWAKQTGQLAPWIVGMYATGGAGGAAAGAGASFVGAGATATRLLQMVGGAFAPAVGMSMVNAGHVYDQALLETGDEEKASEAAQLNFAANIPINLIGGAIHVGKYLRAMKGAGLPLTKGVIEKAVGETAYNIAQSGLNMGILMGLQTIAANVALDHDWNEGLADATVTGGILGLSTGGAHQILGAMNRHARPIIEKKVAQLTTPEEVKPTEELKPAEAKPVIEPTAEETKAAEERITFITENVKPEQIQEILGEIKKQLATDEAGEFHRETALMLDVLEGALKKDGKNPSEVLAEFIDLNNQAIAEMEHERTVIKETNNAKPKDVTDVVNALSGETAKPVEPVKPVVEPEKPAEAVKPAEPTVAKPVEDANTVAIRARIAEGKNASDIAELYNVPAEQIQKTILEEAGHKNVRTDKQGNIFTELPAADNTTMMFSPSDISKDIVAQRTADKIKLFAEGRKKQQQRIAENVKGARAIKEIESLIPEEERAGLNAVFKAFAGVEGMSPEQWVAKRVSGGIKIDEPTKGVMQRGENEYVRGAVQLRANGQAILHLFTGKLEGTLPSNMSTILHEMWHLSEPFLDPAQRSLLEKHLGVKYAEWQTQHRENVADLFEKYWYEGKAPTTELQSIFGKIKDVFVRIYRNLVDSGINLTIPDEVRQVFDSMVDAKTREKINKGFIEKQNEFLSQYNERALGKDKIIGFIDNVRPEDREMVHSKLKDFGYRSEDMIPYKGSQGVDVSDIAYYMDRDNNVTRALALRMKEVRGEINPKGVGKEYELLLRARGYNYDESKVMIDAWKRSALKYEPPKAPATKAPTATEEKPVLPKEVQELFEHTFGSEEQSFSVREASGASARGSVKERQEFAASNHKLRQEAEKIQKTNPELAEALKRVADTQIDNPVDHTVPDIEVTRIRENFDKINQYLSAAKEIADAISPLTRSRMRELYSEHLKWAESPEGKAIMEMVRLDPAFQGTYPFEPMSQERRVQIYEDLGLDFNDGERLPESMLERMLENKNPIYYQKTLGVPDDKAQRDMLEVGKVLENKKVPFDFKSLAKDANVTPEQLAKNIARAYRMLGMPQMIANLDPYGFGKIWKLGNHLREVGNGISSKFLLDPEFKEFVKKSDEHKTRVFKLRVDGTTWGVSSYDAIEKKMAKPWQSPDWIKTSEAKDMVKKGLITQEESDAIKTKQDALRAEYTAKDKSVGKVFSKDEVLKMGYTEEEYKDYKMFDRHMNELTSYMKKSAIMNGMSVADAEKTFSLTGYHPLGRGTGKWSLYYKDPTSPTGYTFTRFETARRAEQIRRSMIDKGIINPKDQMSEVHEVRDHITNYGKHMNDNDLASLIEEAGDFNSIQERLKSNSLTAEEKAVLLGKNELANAIRTEWKKRGYSTARTINRGNVGLVIDPESMIKEYETFVRVTASRYANGLGKAQVGGMVAELSREVPGETWESASNRRAMAKYANQWIDDITRYTDPLESKVWNKLRDVGFLWALGFNTSHGIVNSTQPLITDVPEMHKWRPSIGKNGALLLRTEKEAWKLAFGGKLSEEIKADYPWLDGAINEWHNEGKLKASYLEETVVPGSMPERLRQVATFPAAKSENKNRIGSCMRGAILAKEHVIPNCRGNRELSREMADVAYIPDKALETIALKVPYGERDSFTNQLLKQIENELYEGRISESEAEHIAIKFGGKFSDDVNFVYGKSNRPQLISSSASWLANPMKSAFLFKGFVSNYVGFFINHMTALEPGKSVGYNLTHNIGHKAITLAPLLALAGVTGLPFAGDIKQALKSAGITDVDRDLRELIGNTTYSDLVLKGLPGLLPKDVAPDLSRRVGVGDVLPQGIPQLNLREGIGSIFLGAPAQMIQNFSIESFKDFASGNYTSAYQKMLPVFAGNIIKAVTAGQKGLVTRRGEMLIPPSEVSATESMMQGIGFAPLSFSSAREFDVSMTYAQESRKGIVSSFNERLARAMADNDKDEVQEIISDIVHHNSNANVENYYNFGKNMPAIRKRYEEMVQENDISRTPKALRQLHQRTKPLYIGR